MNLSEYKLMVNNIPVNPFGIPTAQTWHQLGALFDDIDKFEVTLFVELGVFLGGLAEMMLIRQSLMHDFRYFGVQLDAGELHKRIKDKIRIGDVLDPKIVKEIAEIVSNNLGLAMIYCDAGNKPKEMITYTPLLRLGDYIRVHDYPGETSPEFLDQYEKDFPHMIEIYKEKCRELGFSLWRRIE